MPRWREFGPDTPAAFINAVQPRHTRSFLGTVCITSVTVSVFPDLSGERREFVIRFTRFFGTYPGPNTQRSLASRDILVAEFLSISFSPEACTCVQPEHCTRGSARAETPPGTPHSAEDLPRPTPRVPHSHTLQTHMTHTTATRHRTSSGARATDRRSHSTPTICRGSASTVATRETACMPACCAHRRAPRTGRVRRGGGPQSERLNSKHSDVLRKCRRRGRCSQDRRSRGGAEAEQRWSRGGAERPGRGARDQGEGIPWPNSAQDVK